MSPGEALSNSRGLCVRLRKTLLWVTFAASGALPPTNIAKGHYGKLGCRSFPFWIRQSVGRGSGLPSFFPFWGPSPSRSNPTQIQVGRALRCSLQLPSPQRRALCPQAQRAPKHSRLGIVPGPSPTSPRWTQADSKFPTMAASGGLIKK